GFSHIAGQNIVHRDVEGQNVLLNAQGAVKVMDLGEATKATQGSPMSISEFRNVMPSNMSPEMAQARLDQDAIEESARKLKDKDIDAIKNTLTALNLAKQDLASLKKEIGASITAHYDDVKNANIAILQEFDGVANDNWGIGSVFAEIITGT